MGRLDDIRERQQAAINRLLDLARGLEDLALSMEARVAAMKRQAQLGGPRL